MLTPTSSHATHKRGNSLQHMLTELNRKISEISEIKCMISDTIYQQELQQSGFRQVGCPLDRKSLTVMLEVGDLIKYFKHQFKSSVKETLQRFNNQTMESTLDIINYYQLEIKKCKNYYQSEIWDLREEIKRQYKVIAMMKQEVQDLMILMKYKDSPNIEPQQNHSSENNPQEEVPNKSKQNSINSRQYNGELEVIDQETERTLQSSQRSQGNCNQPIEKNSNFIKIQEKEDENDYHAIKMDEGDDGWKNNLNITEGKQNQNQHEVDFYEYTENLTPKETEKVVNDQYPESNPSRENKPTDSGHQNGLCSQHPSPRVKTEEILGEQWRKAKIHTAPSDNKLEHLQSIFFLDDEPEEYFHKTSQIKTIGQRLQFFDSHWDQHNDLRSLQHSHIPADHEYYPAQELYQKKNNEGRSKIYKQQSSRRGSQQTQIKNSMQAGSRGQISTKRSVSEINGGKKHQEQKVLPKSNRIMTQQQTNEYINKKFNKVVTSEQFHSSASVPIFSSSIPLGEVSPNVDSQNGDRQSIQSKPKTRQFLEQFRKTFNKCLKSVQVSKKNSTKLNNSYQKNGGKGNQGSYESQGSGSGNLASGVMTFGKSNPTSNYSSISQKDEFHKQNHNKQKSEKNNQNDDSSSKSAIRAVDQMLKQLENSNKFVIGNKKLELKYEGDKKNGVRSGKGILYYSNGLCYEGEFKDGFRHGYGTLKFNHIQIYNGDWFHDEIQGQGKIRNCAIINKRKTVYSTQTPLGKWISYSGEFKNSKFEGPGSLYLQGGEKFVGHFQNGYACGEGLVYKKNGEVEQGNWRNNFLVDTKKQVF